MKSQSNSLWPLFIFNPRSGPLWWHCGRPLRLDGGISRLLRLGTASISPPEALFLSTRIILGSGGEKLAGIVDPWEYRTVTYLHHQRVANINPSTASSVQSILWKWSNFQKQLSNVGNKYNILCGWNRQVLNYSGKLISRKIASLYSSLLVLVDCVTCC